MGNSPSTPSGQGSPSGRPQLKPKTASPQRDGFHAIEDKFKSIAEVQTELRRQGLESSQLILAVDFTKSNEWNGKYSFGGKNLHHIAYESNPYEEAISIIGKTLNAFDSDGWIHAYGFGDATTGDHSVFSFYPNDHCCNGLEAVLWRYKSLIPHVRLSGPTSFAPAIRHAVDVVVKSGGNYHILLIVADGQVTRSVDLADGELSMQEQDTVDAIVEASNYPLSIVMVGVGDGPWDKMEEFDDRLPQRKFDNFQFVNFTQLSQRTFQQQAHREAAFALAALMEIPEQYRVIQRLRLLGNRKLPPVFSQTRDPPGPPPAPQQLEGQSSYPSAPSYPSPPVPVNRQDSSARYICPITQEVMNEPVIAADGHTYERSAIESWLRDHNTSPMTNQRLEHKTLIPNHALNSLIQEARQRGEIS